MALAMRVAVDGLVGRWRKQGYNLGLGVGIAVGYATLGQIGFEGRFHYGAIGTVLNLASRLCDTAEAGQILITQRVHVDVEDLAEVEPVGDLELKGFAKPVPTSGAALLQETVAVLGWYGGVRHLAPLGSGDRGLGAPGAFDAAQVC